MQRPTTQRPTTRRPTTVTAPVGKRPTTMVNFIMRPTTMVNFMKMEIMVAVCCNNTCYCTLAEIMATSAWRLKWNLKKLLWYRLECQVECCTHTTSWDSLLCNT